MTACGSSSTKRHRRCRSCALPIAIATSLVTSSLRAQVNGTWIGDSGSWTNVTRWTSNPLFPTGGGVATFGPGVFEPWSTVTVNTPVTLSRVSFGNTNLLPNLMGSGGNVITLVGPAEVSVPRGRSRTFNTAYSDEGPRIEGLAGSVGLHKLGAGTLLLGGTNTFSGDIRVSGGVLEYVLNDALGAASNRIILDGGTLQEYGASGMISRDIVLGPGHGTLLAVSTVTYTGTISGSGGLTYDPIASSSRSVVQGTNTYIGPTVVGGFGRLVVSGNGSIRNSSHLIARNGALTFSNGTLAVSNRLPNAPVLLQDGILQLDGNGTISISEEVGTLTIMGGSTITVPSPAAAQTNLAALAIERGGRSVVRFVTAPGISHITFAQPPSLVGGIGPAGTPDVSILPWAVINANGGTAALNASPLTLATYDAGGVRALTSSEFATALPSGITTQNVLLNSNTTVATPTTINALRFTGVASLDGDATVTIASGALMLNSTNVNAPINFGNVEGIITANSASTFNNQISGTNGLTIAGRVTIAGQSSFSGPVTILADNESRTVRTVGDILPNQPGPLGSDSSPIELHTAVTFAPRPASGTLVTIGRDLHFVANTTTLVTGLGPMVSSGTNSINVSGNVGGDGAVVLSGTISISGDVSGPVRLFPAGFVTLIADNDFSGGVEVSINSHVRAGSDTAFGTGTVGLNRGTLSAVGGPRTLANALTIFQGGNFVGSHPLTFAGATEISGGTVSVHDSAGRVTLSNLAPGGEQLFKSGPGHLAVNRLQLPFVQNNAGTLEVLADGLATSLANHVGTLTLAGTIDQPAATLDLTNTDLLLTNTPLATARAAIFWARHGGAWDRPGLTSSAAAAHPAHATTLGLLSGLEYKLVNGSTFGTLPVNDSDVLVKYTYYGDTDFNGVVDFDDYSRTDSGFNNNLTGWLNGEFDYNGVVDFDDYSLIDLAFNTQNGTLLRALSYLDGSDRSNRGMHAPALRMVQVHYSQFGDRYASSLLNAVPEPASGIFLFGVPALAGMSCRLRKRKLFRCALA
jgi:autotransporter-associated beta strand protein